MTRSKTPYVLEIENLAVKAGNQTLVEGVTLALKPAETLVLVGESGSGKTLSALSVMGLLPEGLSAEATKLQVAGLDGLTASAANWRRVRGKDVAMIFQEPATALNPVMTCGNQIAEMFAIHTPQIKGAERNARVEALLRDVQLPDPATIARRYPHELSGGQRQRVMIAMALAHKPKLLVADEPTTALDVTVQAEILKLICDLQKTHGMALLWITHDFGVVRTLSQTALTQIVVLEKGQVRETGSAKQILTSPKHAYTKHLLAATLAMNPKPLVLSTKPKKIVLEAENLGASYPQSGIWFWQKAEPLRVLQGVGFTLPQGTTLGVVGESGSGKSTLARLITKLQTAEQGGRVVVMGQNILPLRGEALRQARRHTQMVFQDPITSLNPMLTIYETLAEPMRAHRIAPEAELPTRIEALLKSVGLAGMAQRYPHQFSGGQRQRIAIARALALNPAIIIADEPVSALDVSIQAQILALFKDVQTQHNTSFVFISHDLRVISHVAHHVLVLHKGKVMEYGPTAQVFAKPKSAYTKQLLKAVV